MGFTGGTCIKLPVNWTMAFSTAPKCLLIVSPLCWKQHCRSMLLAFFETAYTNIATCNLFSCASTATPLASCSWILSWRTSTSLWKMASSIPNSQLQYNSWPFETLDTYFFPGRTESWIVYNMVKIYQDYNQKWEWIPHHLFVFTWK